MKIFRIFFYERTADKIIFLHFIKVIFKKKSSQRASSFNTPRIALFYENNPSRIFEVFFSLCEIHSSNVLDMPLAGAEVEKAGKPWIAAQGRLVSNYDAGSPGSSVGFIIVNFSVSDPDPHGTALLWLF